MLIEQVTIVSKLEKENTISYKIRFKNSQVHDVNSTLEFKVGQMVFVSFEKVWGDIVNSKFLMDV